MRASLPQFNSEDAVLFCLLEKEGLRDLPVELNPWDEEKSNPNYWLSCLLIDEDAMAPMVRGEQDYLYKSESGKSSP